MAEHALPELAEPVWRRPLPLCLGLTLILLLAVLGALATGPLELPPGRVLATLAHATGIHWGDPPSAVENAALLQIRLPRVVLGLLVGAALAASGGAMQGVFRNPLADPALIGVSSGAALGAAAVIVFFGAGIGPVSYAFSLPLAAFAGGAVATWTVARLSMADGVTRLAPMLLAGLAVHAALNALLLGEAEAGHLGVAVERLKRRLVVLVVLAIGASVALTGVIGFVGLIVPHLIRLWAGPDHRLLLPASALLGAILLTLADTAARTVAAPIELPIGILTALVGGPFFIALLLRFRNDGETL